MLCSEILAASLKLLGEAGGIDDNADYAERAPYIIASFIGEAIDVDKKYRLANNIEGDADFEGVFIDLDQEFPLCERLISPAVLYLSSMLLSDESPELSEDYYERYCDSISSVCSSLPFDSQDIKNCYP